jgi:Lipase maturation factor
MNGLLPGLDDLSPLLVWGLFPRLLGLVYLVAIGSLFHQVVPLAGANGLAPIAAQLEKIRADNPSWRRFVYFPTLLWLWADDRALRLLVVVGVAAALVAVYGGPWSAAALLVCWVTFLSLHPAVGLALPWDCLLLESGFLALFLPATNAIPDLSAAASPLPAVAWAYRLLLFRVVFGFGKFKFQGTNRKELGYLKAFLVAMPLPTRLAWYAHRFPRWVHVLGLAGLFVVEILVPFLIFVGGDARVFAAVAIASLMIVIQLTGNWGFFNIVVIALCTTLLDSRASLFDQPLSGLFSPWGHLVTHGVVLVLAVGSVLYFPFNSWCTLAWVFWPSMLKVRTAWVRGLLGFYRVLAPFRVVHAYGVFPPISGPSVRWIPVIEGTRDGKEWREYPYRYAVTGPFSAPVVVAPYHPRLDHGIFYESFGTNVSNFIGSTFSWGNPYHFSRSCGLARLVQRLLEGNGSVVKLLGGNPFPEGPPAAIRVNLYMLQPTTPSERARTGAWWRRCFVGVHSPPVRLDSRVWKEWLPDPELFHPDDLIWQRRSPRMRALMDRARAGADPEAVVADPADGIIADDVCRFWDQFLARAGREDRRDWNDLTVTARRVRGDFTGDQLRLFERILGRLTLALLARVEPYYLGEREPRIGLETLFQVRMLIQHIIGEGKATYDAVYRDPALAAGFAGQMTEETGLFLTGLFWPETLAFHARKFRLLQRFHVLEYLPGLSGFLMMVPFLRRQFEVPGEEQYPSFVRRISDGEWLLVGEPGREASSDLLCDPCRDAG